MTASPKQNPLHVEELLDEALDESFPASDPVAVSPEPAARSQVGRAEVTSNRKNVPVAPEREVPG